jgi:hypothetical protein
MFQVHHAVADGAASVALWEAIDDRKASQIPGAPSSPSTTSLIPANFAAGVRELARLPSQVRRFIA